LLLLLQVALTNLILQQNNTGQGYLEDSSWNADIFQDILVLEEVTRLLLIEKIT
jgi:hypothetical protein